MMWSVYSGIVQGMLKAQQHYMLDKVIFAKINFTKIHLTKID